MELWSDAAQHNQTNNPRSFPVRRTSFAFVSPRKFYPPWTCKLLVGHKADLPAYVVNDEALSLYVAGASGFKGWCLTVGSSEYGDYDVAARCSACVCGWFWLASRLTKVFPFRDGDVGQ